MAPSFGVLGRTVFFSLLLLDISSLRVLATPAMRRPDGYKTTARIFEMEYAPRIKTVGAHDFTADARMAAELEKLSEAKAVSVKNATVAKVSTAAASTGKAQFAYFTNWGIYGANFQPTDIVSAPLTHILYSFADTNPTTGNIFLTDVYADEQKRYPGDTWDEPGTNLYGCLKQLYLLKLRQRNLKVLLSIGGWTYSQAGHFAFVTSASARTTFVNDAVKLIEDYGFDGIDIDFEYPASSAEGQGLANLVTSLRTALTQLQTRKGDSTPYLITAAVGAGPSGYSNMVVGQMNTAMDYWNLMAYDYAGSWLTWTDNQANVYYGPRTQINTDAAVNWYIQNGATASKINLGIPLYGRAFQNTAGLGQPYNGIGPGTIEPGIYSYKNLPLSGASVFQNKTDVTSYSYDSTKREFVSYDTPSIAKMKAIYAQNRNLAGAMFWELSQDKAGADSLVKAASDIFGSLDTTPNHINFPNSKFANVRNNMQAPTTTTTTSTTTSGGPTPTSGTCAGVGAWTSTTIYWGGDRATYGGYLWTAKWWTQGETPSTSAQVWTRGSQC